jgi:hypothetical protein
MTDSHIPDLEQVARIAREELGTARKPATSTETSTETPAGPPKAAPVNVSKRQIEINLLTNKIGREAALEALALGADPQITSEEIAAETVRLQAQADELAAHRWAQTPEGRQAAAAEALKAQQERSRLVSASRALLETDPQLDSELISRLDDQEVLELAGVIERPEKPNRFEIEPRTPEDVAALELRRRWFQMSPPQRIEEAKEAGISNETFQAIAADAAESDNPNIWG